MLGINILNPESICECVYTCTWYSKVVSVQDISLVLAANSTYWWMVEETV